MGLPCELIPIDTRKDQHALAVLATDPNAKVSAIIDGDATVFDSNAIRLSAGKDRTVPARHSMFPHLLRVLGRLPLQDDVTDTGGRRRRSLKGGNRGKVWRGWAGRYGDSVAGGSGWVRWAGWVWAAGGTDRGGWRAEAGELGGRPIPERRARACGDAVSSRAWPSPVDDRRHRRTVFGCRAVGGVIMKCRS